MKVDLVGGFQNTRKHKEDFALTPYLFNVWYSGDVVTIAGLGICWGYYAVYLGLGFNVPPEFAKFRIHK